MNLFDDENKVLSFFRQVSVKSILCATDSCFEHALVESLLTDWPFWTDMSGKNDPPPDFYCDKTHMMMDVMRVNDSWSHVNKRESAMQKEILRSGILDVFSGMREHPVFCITDTHEYSFNWYFKAFSDTVLHHNDRIVRLYQKNHPGYKTVFFIFDESELHCFDGTREVHVPFFDKRFIELFRGTNVDFVVWFMPYKYADAGDLSGLLPSVFVLDVSNIDGLRHVFDYSKRRITAWDLKFVSRDDVDKYHQCAVWYYNMSVLSQKVDAGSVFELSPYALSVFQNMRVMTKSEFEFWASISECGCIGIHEILDARDRGLSDDICRLLLCDGGVTIDNQ